MEVGLVLQDGLGIFGDLAVQVLGGVPCGEDGSVVLAECDTLAASYAFIIVDNSLVVNVERECVVSAMAYTDTAADAVVAVDDRLGVAVHLEFAAYRTAAHAEVLEGAAETCLLVALEVGERDDHIGIRKCGTDFGGGTEFGIVEGNLTVINTFETVGDNDGGLDYDRVEAVLHGGVNVVDGIGASAGVEGVAVGKEWFGTLFLEQFDETSCEVGADICQVAWLAEVEFDGDEQVFEIIGEKTGAYAQPLEFVEQVRVSVGTEIGKVNLGFHKSSISGYEIGFNSKFNEII